MWRDVAEWIVGYETLHARSEKKRSGTNYHNVDIHLGALTDAVVRQCSDVELLERVADIAREERPCTGNRKGHPAVQLLDWTHNHIARLAREERKARENLENGCEELTNLFADPEVIMDPKRATTHDELGRIHELAGQGLRPEDDIAFAPEEDLLEGFDLHRDKPEREALLNAFDQSPMGEPLPQPDITDAQLDQLASGLVETIAGDPEKDRPADRTLERATLRELTRGRRVYVYGRGRWRAAVVVKTGTKRAHLVFATPTGSTLTRPICAASDVWVRRRNA